MNSEIYWINEDKIGDQRIGTMARPRGDDWLADEINHLKNHKVDCLVSLLDPSEMEELGLGEEKSLCEKHDIEFINFPIEDVTTPKNERAFLDLVEQLTSRVLSAKKTVIHCRMGIGRSSILAAAIMIKLGYAGKDVFDIIEIYRGLEVPDTEEQRDWILGIEGKL